MKLAQPPSDPVDFGAHAALWWDANGPMAPLHRLNPARLRFIKTMVCQYLARDAAALRPFDGLTMLDIGCGGGLVTEPLARLGATVTGIDASSDLIAVAQTHAQQNGLAVTYQPVLSETLVTQRKTYDVVLALEVIEHVGDPDGLLHDIAALLAPGGIAILSTPNRTAQSYLKVIVAAEYLLRFVPRGTHDWHAFLKPHELAARATAHGLQPTATMGLHYDLRTRDFTLRPDRLETNYFMVFRHA